MPKFNVTAEFDLYTEIDPDFYGHSFDNGEVADFEDGSYFSAQSVEANGGSITFTVIAEGDDDLDSAERSAERLAEAVISDGMEVEDGNGLTWTVQNVSITVERDEMTREQAFVIVRRLLDRLAAENVITSEEREALDLVIQDS